MKSKFILFLAMFFMFIVTAAPGCPSEPSASADQQQVTSGQGSNLGTSTTWTNTAAKVVGVGVATVAGALVDGQLIRRGHFNAGHYFLAAAAALISVAYNFVF